MSQPLPPYSAYKPAGLPWLEQVPAHWEVVKVKHLFRERSEKGYPDEPLLAATQTQGVVLKTMVGSRTVEASKDFHLLKLVRVGDFVISLRSFEGGIEYAHYQGIISPAYNILAPVEPANAPYLAYLLKSKPFIESLTLFVTGIREGQNIDNGKFSISFLPVPPLPEQQRIVAFLEGKTRQIARLLRHKRQLIKLLNEQKQALIHRAVTQGLDAGAPRKASGVAWLGEVPAHWEVRKVSRSFRLIGSGTTPSSDEHKYYSDSEEAVDWVNTGDLKDGLLHKVKKKVSQQATQDYSTLKVYPAGTFLIAMYGATIGKAGILTRSACTNQACCALADSLFFSVDFVFQAFLAARQHLLTLGYGGGQPNISQEVIRQFKLPCPPPHEQERIIKFIAEETALINETISRAQREIELIQEYRTRLIADVVTGRVDVQQLAVAVSGAALPDELELELAEEGEEELVEETVETDD